MSKPDFRRERGRKGFGAQDPIPEMLRSSAPERIERMALTPLVEQVDATVKWFNQEKGFGFIVLDDGSGEAFLPGSAVTDFGLSSVEPGTPLKAVIRPGPKGPKVAAIAEMGDPPPSTPRPRPPRQPDTESTQQKSGTVKWFDQKKGFGFIAPDDGGKDVFVHVTVLQKHGITVLPEGQRVEMDVRPSKKGFEAVHVRLPTFLPPAKGVLAKARR